MRWLGFFLSCQHLNSEKEFSVSARNRADSSFKLFLCFISIDVWCFRVSPKIYSRTRVRTAVLEYNGQVVGWNSANVYEEYVAYRSRVEVKPESSLLQQSRRAVLMMEATCSSEVSVDFQRTAPRGIPEHIALHNHRCQNLKSYSQWFYYTWANSGAFHCYSYQEICVISMTAKRSVFSNYWTCRQFHFMCITVLMTMVSEKFRMIIRNVYTSWNIRV
jgi:hypothetical protein